MADTSDEYFTMQGFGDPVSASGQGEKAGSQASSSNDCSSSLVGNLATGEYTIIGKKLSHKTSSLQKRRQKSNKRTAELSSEELEERKKERRLYMKNYRAKQSKEATQARLQHLRQSAAERRDTESEQDRKARLQQMCQHAVETRDSESELAKEARLQQMRQHATETRDPESELAKEARLQQMRQHAAETRDSESELAKQARLQQVETPENKDVPKIPVMEEMCWTYEMRRNMQEVVPGLFLGPYSSACRSQLDNLLRTGITHIICIRQDSETQFVRPNFPDKFKYLVLNISLSVNENIIQHFSTVCNFITECLESGGKVLVHGLNGCCRSAALVMAYLMQTYNLNCEQAFNFLLDRRMCISPFERFLCQLKEFEVICRAQRDVHFTNGLAEVKSNKRSIEELAEDNDLPKEKRLFCNRPEEISSAMTPLSESEDLMDVVLS